MENYKWKLKGLSKKINPNKAVFELKRIRKKYGELTPEIIVQESRSEYSILHDYFEWDNERAAGLWRIQQARNLLNNIEIEIISDGKPINIPVYEIVNETGYSHINTFSIDDMETVRQTAIRDLEFIKSKLMLYSQFIEIGQTINDAIKQLKN